MALQIILHEMMNIKYIELMRGETIKIGLKLERLYAPYCD